MSILCFAQWVILFFVMASCTNVSSENVEQNKEKVAEFKKIPVRKPLHEDSVMILRNGQTPHSQDAATPSGVAM